VKTLFRWCLTSTLVLTIAGTSMACPFCGVTGQTMTNEVEQASAILFGTMSGARRDPADASKARTEMKVEKVIKSHEFVAGKETLSLSRFLPNDGKNPRKYLVFFDIYDGKLDPYRGVQVSAESKIAEYLVGAMAVRKKDVAARMLYYFDYLDSPDIEISADALMEFGNADYKDYAPVAVKFPPEKLVQWLSDPNTSPSRYGLYGSLLGHCGNKDKHAAFLRAILDDPKKRTISGLDGLMAGYLLLDPKAGWAFADGIIKDPNTEFLTRYAVLRAMRFFHEFRPDVIPEATLVGGMKTLVEQGDIADLAIEDLRKWHRWELTDMVLSSYDKETHAVPIVRRAIIRFALTAPKNDKAAAFVSKMREDQPDRVRDIEELLKSEANPPAKPSPMPKSKG